MKARIPMHFDCNIKVNYERLKELDMIYKKIKKEEIKKEEIKKEEIKGEEYVWVSGFKGTDSDMCCRGYQYELGKQFDMPEGEDVKLCLSGFHMCEELKSVFSYYDVGGGNRFFKVSALVPKIQTEAESTFFPFNIDKKYAAKSIVFLSECTLKEILSARYGEEEIQDLTDEEMKEALDIGLYEFKKKRCVRELTDLGYSEGIAELVYDNNRVSFAKALISQTNISWDTRISVLFNG